MTFQIFTTEDFDKQFKKLDKGIRRKIWNEIRELSEHPMSSKPLQYKFFREKRMENYRVYFLIYEDIMIVLLVGISRKKDQQNSIDKIKELIPRFKK